MTDSRKRERERYVDIEKRICLELAEEQALGGVDAGYYLKALTMASVGDVEG